VSVRVGLLGTGFWAREAHLPALRALPETELVGCVGGSLEEGQAFAAEQSIPAAYESVELLVDETGPDVLAIVAPDDVHPPATGHALERGVAVFCEKPLANDAATAFALADRERSSGAAATVGFSFRFSPALQAMARDLEEGVLGEPWFVELYEHNPQFHPTRGRPMNWKGDPDHAAAGALFEYGSHAVDLARWLMGDVEAVSTCFTRVRPGALLDDIATLQLRFDEHASGILVASWVLAGGFPGIKVRLHGSELLGEAVLDTSVPGGERYLRLDGDGRAREQVDLEATGGGLSAYTLLHYRAFFDVLAGGESDSLPRLVDGAAVQAVLEAALEATESWSAVATAEAR
jgi:predicted dehydrogenase